MAGLSDDCGALQCNAWVFAVRCVRDGKVDVPVCGCADRKSGTELETWFFRLHGWGLGTILPGKESGTPSNARKE